MQSHGRECMLLREHNIPRQTELDSPRQYGRSLEHIFCFLPLTAAEDLVHGRNSWSFPLAGADKTGRDFLRAAGRFRFVPGRAVNSCEQQERQEYIVLEWFYCVRIFRRGSTPGFAVAAGAFLSFD